MVKIESPYTQSSASDFAAKPETVQRMRTLMKQLDALGCKVTILHDEMVVDAPEANAKKASDLLLQYRLEQIMNESLDGVVPLKIDPSHDKEWDDR